MPEGELFAEAEPALRRRRAAGGPGRRRATRREDVVAAVGDRPVVAHDAKALATSRRNLAHDTLLAAYLLEPARRGYPFRELVEERGLAADVEDPAAARRAAHRARSPPGSASSSTTAA